MQPENTPSVAPVGVAATPPSGTSDRKATKPGTEQILPSRVPSGETTVQVPPKAPPAQNPAVAPRADDATGDSSAIAAENPGAAVDARVRVVSAASPDRGDIAFAVELRPTETRPTETRSKETRPAEAGASAIQEQDGAREAAPLPPATAAAKVHERGEEAVRPETAGPVRKHEDLDRSAQAPESHAETMAGGPAVKAEPHLSHSVEPPREEPARQTAAPDARPARPAEVSSIESKPETQKAAAREIKLEVTGGERRVEVRLSDRGGEVRVAVRTPDNHLAGTLRENLPELATRLAENGLRTEAWRPAGTSAVDWRHATEAPAGGTAQDRDSQSRGQGGSAQEDGGQRHPRHVQEQRPVHKEKGRDFAWLMSSLR
jgi:hypothetical protein